MNTHHFSSVPREHHTRRPLQSSSRGEQWRHNLRDSSSITSLGDRDEAYVHAKALQESEISITLCGASRLMLKRSWSLQSSPAEDEWRCINRRGASGSHWFGLGDTVCTLIYALQEPGRRPATRELHTARYRLRVRTYIRLTEARDLDFREQLGARSGEVRR